MSHILINSIHVQLLTTSIPANQSFFLFLLDTFKEISKARALSLRSTNSKTKQQHRCKLYYTYLVTITIIVITMTRSSLLHVQGSVKDRKLNNIIAQNTPTMMATTVLKKQSFLVEVFGIVGK